MREGGHDTYDNTSGCGFVTGKTDDVKHVTLCVPDRFERLVNRAKHSTVIGLQESKDVQTFI